MQGYLRRPMLGCPRKPLHGSLRNPCKGSNGRALGAY